MMKLSVSNGLSILYNGARRVAVQLVPGFKGEMMGMCGSPNKNQKDDFMTPQGKIYTGRKG